MKLVRESLLEQESNKENIEISAGLAIIQDNTILLAHPKGSKWWGTYSIPKGHVEPGEDILNAAIRETREEVGVTVTPQDIKDKKPKYVDYKDKRGRVYKRVYFFIVQPQEDMNFNIAVDKKEMDWAGFLTKAKAAQRINPRLKPILNVLKSEEE